MSRLHRAVRRWLADIESFSRLAVRRPLRRYQLEPAEAICRAVLRAEGGVFAVMMSRQAGKNETAAQLEAYLLNLHRRRGGQIVKASPTFKPQTINSILRLGRTLENPWNHGLWRREHGYIISLEQARIFFFSAEPGAHVVGATASILLEGDEAQDIPEDKWNKDFRPMAASTNAVTVLWGTAWTSATLLARTIAALPPERVFRVPWEKVAEELPAYGRYVQGEITRLGSRHPLIRSQYLLEEIDEETGMFPAYRQALMHGRHPRRRVPEAGRLYAMLIDVGGEETPRGPEAALAEEQPQRRDATALTIVEVDRHTASDPALRLPTYRVCERRQWRGVNHTELCAALTAIARAWGARSVVIDATGIGHGLASFLRAALGEEKVIPFVFSRASKSQLGYDFLAVVESGRYQDYADDQAEDTRLFWAQAAAARSEVLPGPGCVMRWEVPDPLLHDDLLISASLCALLDSLPWPQTAESTVIVPPDPLQAVDRGSWS